MKFEGTSWIGDICIAGPEEDKRFTKDFTEIFGPPMTKYEEDEWDAIEHLNDLVIAARKWK